MHERHTVVFPKHRNKIAPQQRGIFCLCRCTGQFSNYRPRRPSLSSEPRTAENDKRRLFRATVSRSRVKRLFLCRATGRFSNRRPCSRRPDRQLEQDYATRSAVRLDPSICAEERDNSQIFDLDVLRSLPNLEPLKTTNGDSA